MDVEKRRSKGGFLNFFDWNGKSRKKLFLDNPALPEGSKQGKENVGNITKSLLHTIEVNESRASSSNNGSSDLNCASSVTSDEGNGSRSPGVVARLMGLDSLPTPNVPEPCSTQFFDSRSLRASHSDRSTPSLQSEYHPVDYLNIPNKIERFSWNSMGSGPHKMHNRPVERFQTEILPPKSAKSIPITHHKLLSPIKGPGFIPKKNVAYIMEAAAKIIEASPRATTKGKVTSVGSSSVPMRIRDLKEKIEAAHKTSRHQISKETSFAKYTKEHRREKSHSRSDSIPASKASLPPEKSSSDSLRNKGKSVPPTVQAKVNAQRREGSASSGNRSSMNQKEKNDRKANQFLKSQPDTQKTTKKGTSANRNNNVLRLNNQKQNCISDRDSSTSKTSGSNCQSGKAKSTNGSIGPNRTVNKVVVNSETRSKKTDSVAADSKKEFSSSRRRNLSQKKQSVNGDLQSVESVADNVSMNIDERSIKCNIAIDGHTNWGTDNRKEGMDVVSFTFTSPMMRSMTDPQSSTQVVKNNNNLGIDLFDDNDQPYSKNSALSFPGFSVIGGDALSGLLEQKLRELTCRVESSNCNIIREETSAGSASNLQDSVPKINVVSTTSAQHDKGFELGLDKDIPDSLHDFDCSTIDNLGLNVDKKWQFQQSEGLEEHVSSSNNSETGIEFYCRHPSPVSILKPSFVNGSCSDSNGACRNDSDDQNINSPFSGSKQLFLAQDQEAFSLLPTDEYLPVEHETELHNSAFYISTGDMGRKHTTGAFGLIDFKESSNWELDYVRRILRNAELMSKEFVSGQTPRVISPNLFDQLEIRENERERYGDEYSKLGRKVLFDCVSECLDLRCGKIFVGSCKAWAKWGTLIRRKGWLAEEFHKEISGWQSMGDMMVDELVDKDMSTQYGRWIDFDLEVSEEGVEIENGILTSLVDELVSDLLLF